MTQFFAGVDIVILINLGSSPFAIAYYSMSMVRTMGTSVCEVYLCERTQILKIISDSSDLPK